MEDRLGLPTRRRHLRARKRITSWSGGGSRRESIRQRWAKGRGPWWTNRVRCHRPRPQHRVGARLASVVEPVEPPRGARQRSRRGGVAPRTPPRRDGAPGLVGPARDPPQRIARCRGRHAPQPFSCPHGVVCGPQRSACPGHPHSVRRALGQRRAVREAPVPPRPRRLDATAASHRQGGSALRDRRQCI